MVRLVIQSSRKYKDYLEDIAFDFAGVSDNIAYHLAYLDYLYQLQIQIALKNYPVLHGLRIKTIITELASCAEVLLYDALINLSVSDKWSNRHGFKLKPTVGFSVILDYAYEYGIVDKEMKGRLYKLFDHSCPN